MSNKTVALIFNYLLISRTRTLKLNKTLPTNNADKKYLVYTYVHRYREQTSAQYAGDASTAAKPNRIKLTIEVANFGNHTNRTPDPPPLAATHQYSLKAQSAKCSGRAARYGDVIRQNLPEERLPSQGASAGRARCSPSAAAAVSLAPPQSRHRRATRLALLRFGTKVGARETCRGICVVRLVLYLTRPLIVTRILLSERIFVGI